MAIIAGYGKHLLELVDDTPVTPGETRNAYDGYEASKAIIQDCEDALTNWVSSHASVSSKLSTRARTLSQRRKANAAKHRETGQGVDLAGQDQPMKSDRDSWLPAGQHQAGHGEGEDEYEDEEEEEEAGHADVNGEGRGRERDGVERSAHDAVTA